MYMKSKSYLKNEKQKNKYMNKFSCKQNVRRTSHWHEGPTVKYTVPIREKENLLSSSIVMVYKLENSIQYKNDGWTIEPNFSDTSLFFFLTHGIFIVLPRKLSIRETQTTGD